MIRLKNVVFPEPFGPMIALMEPLSISRDTPLTACSPPKFLVNSIVLRTISFVEDNLTSFFKVYPDLGFPSEFHLGE